jgi:site-specific recombinase XerD
VLRATKDGREAHQSPHAPPQLRDPAVERGVPIHDVQAALGHSSLATSQVYLHVNNETLADRLRNALSEKTDESEVEQLVRRLLRKELATIEDGST